MDRDLHARPEVELVLPLGCATEAPQDQLVVRILPGVPEGNILEQAVVYPKDEIRPGPHLLYVTEHAPHLDIPCPWRVEREEVCHHILQNLHHHRH